MSTADEVREQVEAAFPAKPFLSPVTSGCTCYECTGVETLLRGRSWDELDNTALDAQFGSLPLLMPDALAAFLPAWLLRSLRDLDAKDQKFREWTLYELALYHDEGDGPDELLRKTERLRRRAGPFTPDQRDAIASFLRFMHDRARISDWDRESITRALGVVWLNLHSWR